MKNLIRFLSVIIASAALLSLVVFIWNNRQHYGDWGQETDVEHILSKYEITPINADMVSRLPPPDLPDISSYTVQAIQEKMPKVRPGYLLVEKLEIGYRKLRNRLAFFGEKQGRLDPLSIVISSGVYSLDAIVKEVDDENLIKKREDGVFVLHVPLSVRTEGTLLVNEGETLLLSINTGALISSFGHVHIFKADVKGWDTEKNQPAEFKDMNEFRPHITAWCGSKLNIAGSRVSHLGYQASKSYGISYTSCVDTLYRQDLEHLPGGTGWIIDNVFDDIYFGFYSYEANDVVIVGNLYQNNIVYAIDPHDRSRNLIIAHNTTRQSKQKHGIIVSREVADSYIFKNISEDNNGSGIMIDRSSHNNVVAYNIAQRNKQDGLTFYESPNNVSYKNTLINNEHSGIRIRNSWNIVSQEDVINNNGVSAIQLYSLYLTPERGATYRDLELDPYVQRAGATIIEPEMVGNKGSNFMLEEIESFYVLSPRLYQLPKTIFAGEMKKIDGYVENYLFGASDGVAITKKKDQNLTLNSVDPR